MIFALAPVTWASLGAIIPAIGSLVLGWFAFRRGSKADEANLKSTEAKDAVEATRLSFDMLRDTVGTLHSEIDRLHEEVNACHADREALARKVDHHETTIDDLQARIIKLGGIQ